MTKSAARPGHHILSKGEWQKEPRLHLERGGERDFAFIGPPPAAEIERI